MLLKMNVTLNGMLNDSIVENFGLGNEESDQIMHVNLENPGGNGMYPYTPGLPTETIHIKVLDDYLSENNIPTNQVKYIWIDTEGFEPQVLLGAKNLLKNNSIPIFMEFNPMIWNRTGFYDKMMELLEQCYNYFVIVPEFMSNKENVNLHPLKELYNFKTSQAWIGSMGDIFLVKK